MLRSLGCWTLAEGDRLPSPQDLVDPTGDAAEARWVATYLDGGVTAGIATTADACRLCGVAVGNRQLSDFTYVWPEGLSHYVAEHGVRLPEEFLRHADAAPASTELTAVDDAWWIDVTSGRVH